MTVSKPVIGIAAWRRRLDTSVARGEELHALASEYVDSVSDAGGIPLLLPGARPSGEASTVLNKLDGLVLSGGGDVDPASYGADGDVDQSDIDADRWETALLHQAKLADVPVLAICRGMQVLNVMQGGTLASFPKGSVSREIHEAGPGSDVAGLRHEVAVLPGGHLEALIDAGFQTVNSIHHQRVDRLGSDLTLEAVAGDVIESVSYAGDWFCLGVQWHPERMAGEHGALFADLVQRAGTRALT